MSSGALCDNLETEKRGEKASKDFVNIPLIRYTMCMSTSAIEKKIPSKGCAKELYSKYAVKHKSLRIPSPEKWNLFGSSGMG